MLFSRATGVPFRDLLEVWSDRDIDTWLAADERQASEGRLEQARAALKAQMG